MGVLSKLKNNEYKDSNTSYGVVSKLKNQNLIDTSDTQREVALRKQQEEEQKKLTTPAFQQTISPNYYQDTALRNETTGDKILSVLNKGKDFVNTTKGFMENALVVPSITRKIIDKLPIIGNDTSNDLEESLNKHPTLKAVSNLAGTIVPGVAAEKAAVKYLPSVFNGLKPMTSMAAKGIAGSLGVAGYEGTKEGIENNMGIGGTLQNIGDKAYDYSLGAGLITPAISKAGNVLSKLKTNNALNQIDESMNRYAIEGVSAKPSTNLPLRNIIPPIKSNLKPQNNQSNINLPIEANNPVEVPLNAKQTQSPNFNFENIKRIEDLPNDAPTLEAYVKEMQAKQDNGLKLLPINLQLFAEAQKRLESLSKVYTNTFAKTDMFTQAEKDILNSAFTNDAKSSVKSEIDSLENARRRLQDNYDGEVKTLLNKELYSGEDVDTLFGILEQEKLKARETGDYTKVREIASKGVKEAGREGGRTVQAFAKYSRTPEGKIVEAQKAVDNFADDVLKQNPGIKKQVQETTEKANKLKESIKKETDKVIDESINENATHFPKILKDRIVNSLNPKTPQEQGFIKSMLNDLFGEAKENIDIPIMSRPDNSINKLANAYNFRQYAGEIRNQAQELLKKEFEGDPEALKILDDYFNKGFKPPHSQNLLNRILNKRLGGLNIVNKSVGQSNKPNLSTWVKDWYATGRGAREDFIQSLVKETGLTGDEAQSLKNLLDSKLHVATKQMKDKLLETVMAPQKQGILKNATTKLTELTNIGLLENNKFANRISEKISPVIKQLMRENNINLNEIVRLSQQDKQNALALLKRDVFKNTRVDDKEIVKLLDLVNSEFKSLSKQTQERIFNNLLKEKTAATPKTMIEKLREKINLGLYGDDVDSAIQDAIKEKYGLPTLSNEEVKFITETMDSVKGLPERSQQYLEAMAKVEKLILEKTPASLSQKVGSGAFVNMLLNPTSMITNFGGNALMAIPEQGGNALRRGIDNLLFKSKNYSSGFRTAGKSDFGTLIEGAKQGASQVKRDMLGGQNFSDLKGDSFKGTLKNTYDSFANPIDTDTSNLKFGDKFEVGNRLAFDNKVGRILENLTRSGLKLGDVPFNKAYFDDTLQQIMKANNVMEPTEDMVKTAFQVSQERTYKDSNMLSNFAVGVKNLPTTINRNILGIKPETLKGLKKVAAESPQIVMNSLLPFAKTPANLVKRGLEYSPLGLVEGGFKLAANKGNMSMMKQREIVDRLTRGTIGTGLLGLGALGYKSGLITDARDENKNVENLKQQSGILPDALKVGGKTFDLKKNQPFTTPLIAGSRLMQGKGSDALSSVVGGVEGALTQYSDMSMLQSLAKASQLFASSDTTNPPDKTKIIMDIATSLPKQYIPAVVKKLTYALDPFERDLKSDSSGQYALNGMLGTLPGVSKLFPAKVDVYGNPIQRYDGNNSFANTMFNPYLSKSLKDNPTSNEALRLNKNITDSDLKTGVIPKEVSKDLGDIKLTTEQKNQYQKILGDKTQSRINELLNNPKYVQMDDSSKAIAFSRALDLSREEAKTQMQKELGIKPLEAKKQQLLESANNQKIYGQLKLFKKYN